MYDEVHPLNEDDEHADEDDEDDEYDEYVLELEGDEEESDESDELEERSDKEADVDETHDDGDEEEVDISQVAQKEKEKREEGKKLRRPVILRGSHTTQSSQTDSKLQRDSGTRPIKSYNHASAVNCSSGSITQMQRYTGFILLLRN